MKIPKSWQDLGVGTREVTIPRSSSRQRTFGISMWNNICVSLRPHLEFFSFNWNDILWWIIKIGVGRKLKGESRVQWIHYFNDTMNFVNAQLAWRISTRLSNSNNRPFMAGNSRNGFTRRRRHRITSDLPATDWNSSKVVIRLVSMPLSDIIKSPVCTILDSHMMEMLQTFEWDESIFVSLFVNSSSNMSNNIRLYIKSCLMTTSVGNL